jgi:hypothetical protein
MVGLWPSESARLRPDLVIIEKLDLVATGMVGGRVANA